MQKNSSIADLKSELGSAKDRLSFLENERKSLENENVSINTHSSKLIKSMEAEIDMLKRERETEKKELSGKLAAAMDMSREEISKIKTDVAIEKQELINSYESRLTTDKAAYEEKLLRVERDLTHNFNTENQKLMTENNETKAALDKVLDEYKAKTKYYESELKQYRAELESTRSNLGDNVSQNLGLSEAKARLEVENKSVKELAAKQKSQLDELIEEFDKFKMLHASTLNDSQLELKVRLEKLSNELNAKWSDTLR
jgi:DNA repair exonuclease SbcCD ATPase subunit